VTLPFRLLAVDIDGTLLNSEFEISSRDLSALRHVHALGVEVVIASGRRHTFTLHIAEQLGFDVWICSSNGQSPVSMKGETFHCDLMPAAVAEAVCTHMKDFRSGNRRHVRPRNQRRAGRGGYARTHQKRHALGGEE